MNLKSELSYLGSFSLDFVEINFFGKKIGVLGLLFSNEPCAMKALSYFHTIGVSPIYHAGSLPSENQNPVNIILPQQASVSLSVPVEELDPLLETRIQKESEELDDFFNSLL